MLNQSEGFDSSRGSEDDPKNNESRQKQAQIIVGDDMIPQNDGWVEKLADFVKDVYTSHKHIKLLGCQFGSHLIAYALGGELQRIPSLPDNQHEYIGKETICLKPQFFSQPWVRIQDEWFNSEVQIEFEEMGLLKAHSDVVSKMPEKSILLGSSNRTHHEVWMIQDQVLCFQASPEINANFMKELIINKAYEVGKLLDEQKNNALESIEELEPQLLRHFIMKCIASFLKMPNQHMISNY